jgi:hypothetical protein
MDRPRHLPLSLMTCASWGVRFEMATTDLPTVNPVHPSPLEQLCQTDLRTRVATSV